MLKAINLTKQYGKHIVLDHIDFSLESGHIYGLLGKNGAGKTTTMNILTGYIAPTSGRVEIDGIDLLEHPKEAKRKIGYLPEKPPLYPEMTVLEFLHYIAGLKRIPKADRKKQIDEVLFLTKTETVSGRLIGNLSKGYQQRVGLAYAVLGFPDVIILDEPTVGIDPGELTEIREVIRSLAGDHTVVFSSHILSEVQALCDRVLILNNAKIAARGSLQELALAAGGRKHFSISAAGAGEDVRKVLSHCPFLTGYDITLEENGVAKATVTMPEDIRSGAALFHAFSDADLPLLKIQPEEMTLEKLFLKFAEENKQEEPV